MMPSSSLRIPLALFVLITLLLGSILRAHRLDARGLRPDEAWFAELTYLDSIGEVFHATEGHDQAIPAPLFLIVEHLACLPFDRPTTKVQGVTAFDAIGPRWIPLVSGILAIVLMGGLLRIFFPVKTVAWTMFLVAFSPFFVFWSRDAKQYTTDLAFLLWTFLCVERILQHGPSKARWIEFALIGLLGVVTSYPFVFAYPVAFFTIAWRHRRSAQRTKLILVACGTATLGAFLLTWFLYTIHRQSEWLSEFWSYFYLPRTGLADFLAWHLWRAVHMPNRILNPWFSGLIGTPEFLIALVFWVPTAWGCFHAWRTIPRRFFAYALGPLGLAYAAAALGKYPLEDRLILFGCALPLAFFIHGIVSMTQWLPRPTLRWTAGTSAFAAGMVMIVGTTRMEWIDAEPLGAIAAHADDLGRMILDVPAETTDRARGFVFCEVGASAAQFFGYGRPRESFYATETWLGWPMYWGWPYRGEYADHVRRYFEEHPNELAVLTITSTRMRPFDEPAILEAVMSDRELVASRDFPLLRSYVFDLPRAKNTTP